MKLGFPVICIDRFSQIKPAIEASVSTDGGVTSLATDNISLNDFTTKRTGDSFDDSAQTFRSQNLYSLAGNSIRYTIDPNGKYAEAQSENADNCIAKAFDSDGNNAKYISEGDNYSTEGDHEHIDISVNFDVSNLPEATILDGSYSLYYTLKLEQKQDADAVKGYTYVKVPIDSTEDAYLKKNSLTLYSKGAAITPKTTNNNEYTYQIPLPREATWLTDYSAGQFTARLSFDVKTAGELERISGYLYGNYRVSMTASIVKTDDITSVYAGDDDCIVWTNAMINPHFVTKFTQSSHDP